MLSLYFEYILKDNTHFYVQHEYAFGLGVSGTYLIYCISINSSEQKQ